MKLASTAFCWALPGLLACLPGAAQAEADLSKPVQIVAARQPIPAGQGGPKSFKFEFWKTLLKTNDVVGSWNYGLFCNDPKPLRAGKPLDDLLVSVISRAFYEELVKAGYSDSEQNKSLFDDKLGGGADYRVGATLIELDYRSCGRDTHKGSVYSKIKWEVFSTRRQKVIYAAAIDASLQSEDKALPAEEFRRQVGRTIVNNLLGDPAFAEAVRTDGEAGSAPDKTLSPLALDPKQTVSGVVMRNATPLLAAVVTIESAVGSGSGFFISQDGYLLTNQHVVSDAKFVRVKLSNGHSMVGEVIRANKPRDVALVKTDPTASPVLQLRHGDARIGEEVYALGSPYGEVLSGTLTKGVLSARRVFDGVAYLQSDVAINPGSSGGPLIDTEGAVLGIAQSGASAKGINIFIPIDEALDKLALSLSTSAVAKP
ncbi:MAG TPA: trypsin-like peptidase domain-containing protein [Methylibium sp.]